MYALKTRFSKMFYLVIVLLLTVGKVSLTTVDNNEGNTKFQLLQGDIVLTEAQQALIETLSNQNNPNGPQHAVTKILSSLWKEGIVPYIMDNSLSSNTINVINDAIREYENQTCIRFRKKRENDTDYLKFYKGYGCSSYIGRVGGEQGVSIGLGCERKGVVIHEIFHALGRWHEQARPDRNLYVRIYPENIRTGYARNFDRVDPIFATTQGVPYDFDSLMHYGAYAFSTNGKPTIIPIDSTIDKTRLGQRDGFSINDILHVKALYCPGNGGSWSSWSSWSSCSRTCNGGIQYRKRVCVGNTDCSGVNYQERQCNTTTCPTPPIWSSWGTWSGCSTSCGRGRRSRMRTCLNGTSCIGKSQEYEDCNLQACPKLPVWSGWSSWSECSHTCQGGYKYRTRRCQNGANIDCSGVSREVKPCNDDIVCNKWTECSKTCGTGVQFRIIGSRNRTEQRHCNTQPCHNESCIQGITHIGCFKLPAGTLQLMDGRHQLLMDSPYNRTEPIRKCGQVAYANKFRYFAVAFGLCFSGFNNISHYQTAGSSKICKNGTGNYFGSFSMDVYNISDVTSFITSINYITECGMDYCQVNRTCTLSSGSGNIHLPHLSCLLIIILILYYAIY